MRRKKDDKELFKVELLEDKLGIQLLKCCEDLESEINEFHIIRDGELIYIDKNIAKVKDVYNTMVNIKYLTGGYKNEE